MGDDKVIFSNPITWVFEEGTFRPAAKLTEKGAYSIITDYLGTPVEMYNKYGEKTWETRLDIYGKVASFEGGKYESSSISDCPFRYQGQYEDSETGLYYNRFRYYSPEEGMYISQDPIGLAGGNPTLYGYVHNPNSWVDVFGLMLLFRSMAREEFFDIMNNGWDGKENMGSKWFAESYDDAVTWGNTMGHGTDSKFYVVGFNIDDKIANNAFISGDNHDGIGKARAIDVDELNKKPIDVHSVNTHRIKCKK